MRALTLTLLVLATAFSGCETRTNTAEVQQSRQTSAALAEANARFGMPAIREFREKRMMLELYQLRDRAIATYTYVKNLDGSLTLVCPSIGFGLPYATQYSNPERVLQENEYWGQGPNGTIPQAEPNGLYMPGSAEATWVICATEGLSAIYIEERTLISTFPLRATGGTYFDAAAASEAPSDPSLGVLNEGIERSPARPPAPADTAARP